MHKFTEYRVQGLNLKKKQMKRIMLHKTLLSKKVKNVLNGRTDLIDSNN